MAAGATQITLRGVRNMLALAKRTGSLYGVKSTTEDVKDAIRMVYNEYGPEQADRFVTGWNTDFDKTSLMQDAAYGFDEIQYPRGSAKLPKGTVAASPKINRRATAPFKASRFSGGEDPRAKVMGLARSSELKQKAAKAAVAQQFAMDRAQKAGQITDREIVRQNRILMRRRKQA